MPIYEYFCKACETQSEIMHKISDPPATDCPKCGKPALTKQVSAAGFRLKGAGWYETDFKSDKQKQRNLAGEGGATAEQKPAAETSAAPAAAATESKTVTAAPAAKPATPASPTPAS